MRYFCFTYQAQTNRGYKQGNYYVEKEKFPSKNELESELYNHDKNISLPIIFLNIFEFKNEEDYNNFINN